jgi:hypothetical protein
MSRFAVRLLAASGAVAIAIASCAELRGSVGDDCLKDQDCLSGVCTQLRCAAAPSVLEAGLPASEASTLPDTSTGAAEDATIDGPGADGGPDAPDGSTEAAADAADGGTAGRDGGGDATTDAAAADGASDATLLVDTGAADAPVDVRPGG